MEIKINLEKFLFNMIISFHFMSALLSAIGHDILNKYAILFLVVCYFYFIKYVSNRKSFILVNCAIFLFSLYNLGNMGFSQIKSSDYYSFILLMLLFIIYSNQKMQNRFLNYFLNSYQRYISYTIAFWIVIMYSIFFKNGIQFEPLSSIPILHGPYEIQHVLGYVLIGIYCGISLGQNYLKENKIYLKFLKILCVIGAIATGARSAVLAFIVVILFDFFQINKLSKKLIIFVAFFLVGIYLFLYTDIIYKNAFIQRTIYAASTGSISNGRERFANILLENYSNMDLQKKLFGIGMENLRLIMRNARVGGIHAHNDYINSLVGYGLCGLLIYIWCQIKLWISVNNIKNGFLLEVVIFILAYFNGLAMYMAFSPELIIVTLFFKGYAHIKDIKKERVW